MPCTHGAQKASLQANEAKKKKLEDYEWLCRKMAHSYYAHLNNDDKLQTCRLALVKAINKYDHRKGSLAGYAKKIMNDELRQLAAEIGYPLSLNKNNETEALKTYEKLVKGEPLTEKEQRLAGLFCLSFESFDYELDEEGTTLHDQLADESSDPAELATVRHIVALVMAVLDECEKQVTQGMFGLDGHVPTKQEKIAQELGLSQARVSQLCKQALKKMKKCL